MHYINESRLYCNKSKVRASSPSNRVSLALHTAVPVEKRYFFQSATHTRPGLHEKRAQLWGSSHRRNRPALGPSLIEIPAARARLTSCRSICNSRAPRSSQRQISWHARFFACRVDVAAALRRFSLARGRSSLFVSLWRSKLMASLH